MLAYALRVLYVCTLVVHRTISTSLPQPQSSLADWFICVSIWSAPFMVSFPPAERSPINYWWCFSSMVVITPINHTIAIENFLCRLTLVELQIQLEFSSSLMFYYGWCCMFIAYKSMMLMEKVSVPSIVIFRNTQHFLTELVMFSQIY